MFKNRVLSSAKYKIKYSQNYLSQNIARRLVNDFALEDSIPIIEIGAGKGNLTKFLTLKCSNIIAIELDKENCKYLKQQDLNGVKIVNEDFLKYILPTYKYNIVGNIPFAKSSDIVRKLLLDKNQPLKSYLIVQKEFAQRLTGNEFFTLQFKPWFEIKIIKCINRFDIKPIPNVDVVLIQINKRGLPLISNKEDYLDFMAFCFSTRKDSLQKILNKFFSFKQIGIIQKEHSINLKSSPGQIKFEQWLAIFKVFERYVDVSKKTLIQNSFKKLTHQQDKLNKRKRTNIGYND